jgi:hypothetical protein
MPFRPGAQSVRKCLGLVVTLTSAAGCAPAPDPTRHTVEEYRQDAELRRLEIARCVNDPARRGTLPDCVNAREAERLEGVGTLRNLAPLHLPDTPGARPGTTRQEPNPRN